MSEFINNTKFTLGTIVVRDSEQEYTSIDNEVVMFSKLKGEYYALNEIGSRIWGIIKNPVSLETIIEHLTYEYEVERETCMNHTVNLLLNMFEKSLLKIIDDKESI